MLVKNYRNLATDKLRQDGLAILNAGLLAIAPDEVVGKLIRVDGKQLMVDDEAVANLGNYKNIWIVGAGKVAHAIASRLESTFGEKLAGGLVVGTWEGKPGRVEYVEATHPLPSTKNMEATKRLVELGRLPAEMTW